MKPSIQNRRSFVGKVAAAIASALFWPRILRAAGLYNVGAFWQKIYYNHLWVWGTNTYGQLGTGNVTSYSSPVQVAGSWTQVDSGWTCDTTSSTVRAFSLGIKTDGTLWAWGDNTYGELGQGTHGTAHDASSPVQIAGNSWIQASCGGQGWNNPFGLAIRVDGSLWAWGDGSAGTLGQGTTTSYSSPVQIMPGTTWRYVAGGYCNWLAIQTNGTLWACGGQGAGELGVGSVNTGYSSPVQVGGSWSQVMIQCDSSAGGFAAGIKADGSLWGWGGNFLGDCGIGNTTTNQTSPVLAGGSNSWTQVSIGAFSHGLAIRSDGTLWAWGNNGNGQLGTNDTNARSSPTQIGSGTWRVVCAIPANSANNYGASLAIRSDGTLWGWGYNGNGQLGNGGTTSYSSPVMIAAGNWGSVIATGNTVMALR
jgi:alpha-tubulin suppressor-like RCC1 family protein